MPEGGGWQTDPRAHHRPFAGQVADIVINANEGGDRFTPFGFPVVADSIAGYAGPLAGVHAGLEWAKANHPDIQHAVTVATDTPFFPSISWQGCWPRRRTMLRYASQSPKQACTTSSAFGPWSWPRHSTLLSNAGSGGLGLGKGSRGYRSRLSSD